MSLRIAGLGLAVPEHAVSQSEAADVMVTFLRGDGRARAIRALHAHSGIRKRHSVLLQAADGAPERRQSFYAPARDDGDLGPATAERMRAFENAAPPLLERAAGAALADAGLGSEEITHLVTVSCTGFFAPGLDAALIDRLGLPRTVQRTHVGFMGCHGALNGLRVAASLVAEDPEARVLLGSVELCTLHLAYGWDPEAMVANALFSDGAAAAVGVRGGRGKNERVGNSVRGTGGATPRGPRWEVAASGTLLIPDSQDAMSWRIGDHGFRMTLSACVPALVQAHVGDWLRVWLGEQGVAMEDVRSWAVHPGGPRVLSAFGRSAGLGPESFAASRDILAEYGNMSSATLLFILHRLREAGSQTPLVALAFGPGLTVEVALLR